MAKHKDKIKGGLADNKKPSDFDSKSLAEGQKVELEHTRSKNIAREIAMDHLSEDADYYKKLKMIEKNIVETTPDGKQEIVEGKESLKKDPKSIKNRWLKLKKGLNNLKSIMDLKEEAGDDEKEKRDMLPGASQMPQNDEGQQSDQSLDQQKSDESDQSDESGDDAYSPQEEQPEQPQEEQPEQPQEEQPEQPQEEQPEQPQEEQPEQPSQDQIDEQEETKIIQALKEEGYSEPEIAYIVHGMHSPVQDDSKLARAEATKAMSDIDVQNATRLGDLELQHKTRQMDLDHEHNKRMKDLEYKSAGLETPDIEHKKKLSEMELEEKKIELERRKKEIEMELEFKRKELELKLKHAEQTNRKKLLSNSKGSD